MCVSSLNFSLGVAVRALGRRDVRVSSFTKWGCVIKSNFKASVLGHACSSRLRGEEEGEGVTQ